MEPTLYDESMYQGMFGGGFSLIWLLIVIVFIVANWKIFEKAGRPGWYSLIPFYNTYQLFQISGLSGWWFLGLFIPFINIFVFLYLAINLAHAFGKSTAYGIFLLWLLSGIGMLMLGFGSAQYQSQTSEPVPAKS